MMKNGWRKIKINEVAKTISGFAFKSSDFIDEGIPVVKIANIKLNAIDISDMQSVDERFLEIDQKYHINSGDILISLTGSHLTQPNSVVGRVAKYPHNFKTALLNQRAGRFLVDDNMCDSDFLYYWLSTFESRRSIALMAHGAANQANVSPGQIGELEIYLPELYTQRAIASILSAYDDLIENNTRRIKILEEMARLIYREWFVEFKAPGIKLRKATPEEKKVTGKDVFPEGWEIGIVNDLLSLKSGFAFKSGTFSDSGRYGLVTIKNVQDGVFNPETTSRLDEIPDNMPDYCFIETGDILMSLTGNIGRVCLTYGSNLLLNQRVSKIVPLRKEDKPISYCLFRQPEMQRKLEMIANGVAQQNLSPVETGRLVITIPSKEIRDEFHKIMQPLLEMIVQLYQKNTNLRQTRDLLLPKLISGDVEV